MKKCVQLLFLSDSLPLLWKHLLCHVTAKHILGGLCVCCKVYYDKPIFRRLSYEQSLKYYRDMKNVIEPINHVAQGVAMIRGKEKSA